MGETNDLADGQAGLTEEVYAKLREHVRAEVRRDRIWQGRTVVVGAAFGAVLGAGATTSTFTPLDNGGFEARSVVNLEFVIQLSFVALVVAAAWRWVGTATEAAASLGRRKLSPHARLRLSNCVAVMAFPTVFMYWFRFFSGHALSSGEFWIWSAKAALWVILGTVGLLVAHATCWPRVLRRSSSAREFSRLCNRGQVNVGDVVASDQARAVNKQLAGASLVEVIARVVSMDSRIELLARRLENDFAATVASTVDSPTHRSGSWSSWWAARPRNGGHAQVEH